MIDKLILAVVLGIIFLPIIYFCYGLAYLSREHLVLFSEKELLPLDVRSRLLDKYESEMDLWVGPSFSWGLKLLNKRGREEDE